MTGQDWFICLAILAVSLGIGHLIARWKLRGRLITGYQAYMEEGRNTEFVLTVGFAAMIAIPVTIVLFGAR